MRLMLLLMATLMVAGCEDDAGPTGPSGAADVVSGTISPTSGDWDWYSPYGFSTTPQECVSYKTRFVEIPVAEITPEVVAGGAVLVYLKARDNWENWTPLNFSFHVPCDAYSYNICYTVTEGLVRLHYFFMPDSVDADVPLLETYEIPPLDFRYVVIGASAIPTLKAEGVDLSDPDRVIAYLTVP